VSKTSSADLDGSGIDAEQGEPSAIPRRQKTGGRQKGTPNRKTAERAKLLNALKVDGKDPVSFFGSILRNEDAPLDLRFSAARELAPYAHPKLSSIEARTGGMTHEDRLAELQEMLKDDVPLMRDEGGTRESTGQAGGGLGPPIQTHRTPSLGLFFAPTQLQISVYFRSPCGGAVGAAVPVA
jgi:hypothetical protein